mgnify:FL=1
MKIGITIAKPTKSKYMYSLFDGTRNGVNLLSHDNIDASPIKMGKVINLKQLCRPRHSRLCANP